MTNQDAIKILKSKMDGNTDTSYEWCECMTLAIKTLEKRTKTHENARVRLYKQTGGDRCI